jgi:hypothetical protein
MPGYADPPKAFQFRPGVSGNAGGRPARTRAISEIVAEQTATTIEVAEAGGTITVTKLEALIRQLLTTALKGDVRAAKMVLSLCQGSPGPDEQDERRDQVDQAVLEDFIRREVDRRLKEAQEKKEQR